MLKSAYQNYFHTIWNGISWGIAAEAEVNETYDAKVVSIMPYGAFVEFMPGKEGLFLAH